MATTPNPIPGPIPGLDEGMSAGIGDATASQPVIPPSNPQPVGPAPDIGGGQPGNPPPLPPRPPGTGVAAQPPPSKAEFFRNMLGQFFYAVGTGLANRGTGPDADARGAGAALTALPNRDIMQQQLEIQRQQAQGLSAYHGAQANALQNRSQLTQVPMIGKDGEPVKGADGSPVMMTLPADQAEKYLQATGSAAIRGGATTGAAQIRANATTQAATTKANAGQVAITPGIAKSLGMDASTVGQNLNPAQIKALTPRITAPNLLGLIAEANKGDKDAQAILDTKQKMDESLMKARGMAFGQGRLWSLQTVYDPETGETNFATGFNILQAQQQGKNLMPVGKLPQDKIVAVQQLQSEATPALKNFESAIKAFDNPSDRAIFARVMKGSGDPVRGDESTWLGNVFNQAAKEDLSPDGKKIATQYGPRLAETMGRLRSTLGLQATDAAMGLTLRLIPGGSTPDAATAKGQLGQIREMIDQAVGIPALRGGKGVTPKGGGDAVQSLIDKYKPK